MRLSHAILAVLLGCLAGAAAQAQEPIRFARMADISPDGKLVAFSYVGDIWVVEAIGGVARPVTTHVAHETAPVFSPDGRTLAFSSNRHGSYDVFTVPVHGGRPKRLTFDSGADLVSSWSRDGKRVLFSARRSTNFPPVAELYTIPVEGGREERISAFEGRDGAYSPAGDRIAYVQGPGIWYRKGYRGSANDDLWVCRADGAQNTRLTSFNGQDGSPMWSADGQWVYYVSEHFGPGNICRMRADGSGAPQQVTHHKEESVRRARMSGDGHWIVYECEADLWVCSAQEEPRPRKIAIEAYADDKHNPEQIATFTQNISEYVISPNDQHVAFVVHGEIFLMPMSGGKARRVTDHPGNDHDLAWSPDMKKLLFVSDRGGQEDLYVVEHNDPEHPELVKAQAFKVTRLNSSPELESGTSFSPDGKRIAFLRGGKLWTMQADGSNAKVLVDQARIIDYDWSPDGKWLVYSRLDGTFASELYIMPADGGEARNVTRYATWNAGVSWSSDGKKLGFVSQRRRGLDAFVLSMQKPAREGDAAKDPGIDFDDIHLRVDRSTSLSAEEMEAALRPDGSQVAFRARTATGDDLWLAAANGSQVTRLTSGNLRPRQIRWSKSGSTIHFLDANGALRTARPGGMLGLESIGQVRFTARMRISRDQEFAQMFDEAWRKLSHHFYDPAYHGTNWVALRLKYQPLVKHVAMHEDFYDLVSLMLGELNASHLGIGRPAQRPEEVTGDLGLLWDESYRGPGLRVREVLKRGPADLRGLDLKPGEYVIAINGTQITETVNLSQLLNEMAGEAVTLHVAADPKDPKRRRIEIKAAPRETVAELMYQRWVASNAKHVEALSSGKLGYIHLRGMDDQSLDEFVRRLYSDNFEKEAIVLDVRYNSGGFTHDQVLGYLGGKDHTYFVTRDGTRGPVLRANDRKWTKPLVLLCNNRSYSDAEIFPHAFRDLGLGKLVGMPTGGYVIGTFNDRLIDGSFFRVPRLGVFTATGANMERGGVVPDIIVDLHPDQLAKGQDAQLDKAVEVLTKDVEAWKKTAKPAVAGTPAPAPTPMPANPGDK